MLLSLKKIKRVKGGLHIGAGVTINNLRRVLLEKLPLVAPEHAGNYHALLENIRWFAGDQVPHPSFFLARLLVCVCVRVSCARIAMN